MIHKIAIYPTEISLIEPFVISIGARTHVQNIFVKIYDDQGCFGTGECGIVRTVIKEKQADQVLIAKKIGPYLLGKNPQNISFLSKLMDQIHPEHSSIKCAFDMAIYDLCAKRLRLPLYQYLGGNLAKRIYTDMTVSMMDSDIMAIKAKEYVAKGFASIKVKLGDPNIGRDIERIKCIRQAIGFDVPLSIDANQGWTVASAHEILIALEQYNIDHCEAPIDAKNTAGFQSITAQSPIAIMGDETVFDHHDAYQMLHHNCIDSINIKLGKSEGIHKATKIAAICDAAKIKTQVGCFSETRLGLSALAHFSLAHDCISLHDMDSSIMHSEDPIIGGIQFGDQYEVLVTDSDGHGAIVDEKFLARFDRIDIDTANQ